MFGQNLIASLNTYDRLADMYGSQIGGQVRTGYKQATPRIGGSGDAEPRAPESGVSLHTTLDLTQGAVVKAADPSQLAIQGKGFFLLTATANLDVNGQVSAGSPLYVTRDGDFHQDSLGRLVNGNGLALVTPGAASDLSGGAAVYGDDTAITPPAGAIRLNTFLANPGGTSLVNADAPQNLTFTNFGSTIYSTGDAQLRAGTLADQATVLSGALEASNSSSTQAVPMLAHSQKMFAATTKVMTTHNNNIDALLAIVK